MGQQHSQAASVGVSNFGVRAQSMDTQTIEILGRNRLVDSITLEQPAGRSDRACSLLRLE